MDEIDLAQQNDELFRQQALMAHFRSRSADLGSMLACGEAKSVGRLRPTRGMCCDCGDDIGAARLGANPDAVRCLECQTKKERRTRNGE